MIISQLESTYPLWNVLLFFLLKVEYAMMDGFFNTYKVSECEKLLYIGECIYCEVKPCDILFEGKIFEMENWLFTLRRLLANLGVELIRKGVIQIG